jgi:hypothetical protein
MRPGALARELLHERRSDDREAEALARGVAQVGDGRVDQGSVAANILLLDSVGNFPLQPNRRHYDVGQARI